MSKPYSIDPIAPDLLSLMTDSNGAVLPHAASTRDDTRAMGNKQDPEDGPQQLQEWKTPLDTAPREEDDGEGVVRQRQKDRRQQRHRKHKDSRPPGRPLGTPSALQTHLRRYLRVQQLAERWDVSVPTVWRWAADGKIPSPLKLSPGTTRWRLDEIEAYEQSLEGDK